MLLWKHLIWDFDRHTFNSIINRGKLVQKFFSEQLFFENIKIGSNCRLSKYNILCYIRDRRRHQRCSATKDVLINFAKFPENICARVFFLVKLQADTCEFWEISKNIFFTEQLWTTGFKKKFWKVNLH